MKKIEEYALCANCACVFKAEFLKKGKDGRKYCPLCTPKMESNSNKKSSQKKSHSKGGAT